MTPENQSVLRTALRDLPQLAAHSTGTPPDPSRIFFPEGHADALDPEVALVIGNRGMGKSFWASALEDINSRIAIGETYMGRAKALRSQNLSVVFGFADAEGANGVVSRIQLESISESTPTEVIWRAVIYSHLALREGISIPSKFKDLVEWISNNMEEQQVLFRQVDRKLAASGEQILFLFDQLEQLASSWPRTQTLTQGLLKTALAVRSYRSIKIKIFMRPDQADNKDLFRFPDAAKISGSSVRLRWRPVDLYGLLFFEILREDASRRALIEVLSKIRTRVFGTLNMGIPDFILKDENIQRRIFEEIAGQFMGANVKKGRPYTWIPVHLADGRLEISPRSFLRVMKTAADVGTARKSVIDYAGLQEGVRQASENRLTELSEDYPWVQEALYPLRGLLVPAEDEEIIERWLSARVINKILQNHAGMSAPLDIALLSEQVDERSSCYSLLVLLEEIGVVEQRANGKINVPDIFRVNAGIRRRGGITPEQRRLLG